MEPAAVTAFMDEVVKACVELLLSDGRTAYAVVEKQT